MSQPHGIPNAVVAEEGIRQQNINSDHFSRVNNPSGVRAYTVDSSSTTIE